MNHRQLIAGTADLHDAALEPLSLESMSAMLALLDRIEAAAKAVLGAAQ